MRIPLVRLLLALALGAVAAPAAEAQDFHAVTSRDGLDVWAVGDSGRVARSLDAGATWAWSTFGLRPLRAVVVRGFAVVIAGDSGQVWRSVDSGGQWGQGVLPGVSALHALAWPAPDSLFAVGGAGAIYRSADSGLTWTPQASGTDDTLRAVRFADAREGWVAGDRGTVRRTLDGGANWTPVAVPTTRRLLDLDLAGATVWLVGERGVALRSGNGGAGWSAIDLETDVGAAVAAVRLAGPDTVWLAGGGGFLRRSVDGGATWTFASHTLQAPLADVAFAGPRGWAAGRSGAILRTADGGASWSLPAGTVQQRSWTRVFNPGGTMRGSTFALNPIDQRTLYVMVGRTLFRSRDEAVSWSPVGSVTGATTNKTNAFVISPKDTNVMLAAVSTPDRIVRSEDGGLSWSEVLGADFGEFGVPLEVHPDRPDTVYFGPDDDVLYRSPDFGQSWLPHGSFAFRSPCDLVVVPGIDSTVIVVGDGITNDGFGSIHRSNDGGQTWRTTYGPTGGFVGSEVPMLNTSRLGPAAVYATSWSNGYFKRSLDQGLTWQTALTDFGTTWGTDVAKDDPGVVVVAAFSGNNSAFSFDGGSSFVTVNPLGGANYGIYMRDRAFVLAQQSTGIYKLVVRDSFALQTAPPSLAVTAPLGGESWTAGETRRLGWDAVNVPLVRLEWRSGPAEPWQPLATVAGYAGGWDWLVPPVATSAAEVRVLDAWDGAPVDVCDAPFSILAPGFAASPVPLAMGAVLIGEAVTDTLRLENTGTAPLVISSITSDRPTFRPGRTSLVLEPGAADTLGVTFTPEASGEDSALVTFVSGDAASPHLVRVRGRGVTSLAADGAAPAAFAVWQNEPNPFRERTSIRYSLPSRTRVSLEVFDVQGHRVARLVDEEQGPGRFAVPFGPGQGRGPLATGVYFYRFQAGGYSATRKMLLLR